MILKGKKDTDTIIFYRTFTAMFCNIFLFLRGIRRKT